MSFKAVKRLCPTSEDFEKYVLALGDGGWRPTGLVVHNTGAPNLDQWLKVGGLQRINNLERYYRDERKWSGGPHLFIAREGIHVFNPLDKKGVHSPSWNNSTFGVEIVGDYDGTDDWMMKPGSPKAATIERIRELTFDAVAILTAWRKIDTSAIRFHKEDPLTDHDCPGKTIIKADFVKMARLRKIQTLERWGQR